jgi:predicted nucleic acid-binding protein
VKRYLADSNVALAATAGEVLINLIVYAEIAPAFLGEAELEEWISAPDSKFQLVPIPFSAAWPAAQAYKRYRKAGGSRKSILPDFYIGAHAQVEGLTLITRDAARYRTYFPGVELIAPA